MPSSVVIALPLTAATGVTQERISLPSRRTEHAPHCARPQPKRGPCRCSSLCRTYSRGVSRLAVTLWTRPFTLIFNLLAIRSSSEGGREIALLVTATRLRRQSAEPAFGALTEGTRDERHPQRPFGHRALRERSGQEQLRPFA